MADFLRWSAMEKFNENTQSPTVADNLQSYDHLTNTFRNIVDKHAPIKTKLLRGNNASFMNPELRKAMYTRARLKRRLNKHPSNQNEVAFKKQRNRCDALRKKAIKNHFKRVTNNGLMSNKLPGIW